MSGPFVLRGHTCTVKLTPPPTFSDIAITECLVQLRAYWISWSIGFPGLLDQTFCGSRTQDTLSEHRRLEV